MHPHEPDTVFVFTIIGGDRRYPPEAKARVWRSQDAGESCMLFTDLANPTTNRLYPRIGYLPVHDAVQLHFCS